MKPKCPTCHSSDIQESAKFDLTLVEAEECRHDFECNKCETLFQIVYKPMIVLLVETGTPSE